MDERTMPHAPSLLFSRGGWRDGRILTSGSCWFVRLVTSFSVYNMAVFLVGEGEGFVRDLERQGVGDVCSSVVVDE